MNPAITGIGAYVPERRMHNDELSRFVDTSDEWIYSRTGIRYRYIAADDQSCADLGVEAAKSAMTDASVEPTDVDLILVATSTPDYLGLPSTAAVVQHKLGASQAAAMDVSAACTGFVYALETARVYIAAGAARTVLVIGAEVFSRILDWSDRTTCVLFGDGAGAAVVQSKHADPPLDQSLEQASTQSTVTRAILAADGSGAEVLARLKGGTKHPFDPDTMSARDTMLYMDGRRVYNFAVRALPKVLNDVMTAQGLAPEEIDWVVPHQANLRIIREAAKRSGIPHERFYTNLENFANTSAASIPLALDEMNRNGLLRKGMKILIAGFGGGLTYGGSYIIW